MRYPEEKIREAVLNPDPRIRARAVHYFAKSSRPDALDMSLVIRAVETYGRAVAYRPIGYASDLPQSDESVAWIIDELNREHSAEEQNYVSNLSKVLVNADPALLLPKETAVLESRHFSPELRVPFAERLRMLSWDPATCWRRLEEFCERNRHERALARVDFAHGRRIVEALARHGAGCEERVHALLSEEVEDVPNDPFHWMEPLAVRLAGRAHLNSAVPLIVAKLMDDRDDLLNDESADALVRIGTPEVLHAIAAAFPEAPPHFRMYAGGPLENIHSDLAIETCRRLLRQEPDDFIQRRLAEAMLCQFDLEGIPETRRLLQGHMMDFARRGLRLVLLETCAFTGERFPEYDEWAATEMAESTEFVNRLKEVKDDPRALLRCALERLAGVKFPDAPKAKPRLPPPPARPLPPRPAQKTVGRNDRCPCGSGKKFKSCCLRNPSGY